MNDKTSKQLFNTLKHTTISTPFGIKPLINADSTASGYPYPTIEEFIQHNILPFYSNTHSNALPGQIMSHYIDLTKNEIRKQLNASNDDSIIFTGSGCTGAINHLIHLLELKDKPPNSYTVITSVSEHHSNYLPWTELGCHLILIGVDFNGLVDPKELEKNLQSCKNSEVYVTLSATSNVTGVIQNTSLINKLVHKYRGKIFWDFAASAPYLTINLHQNPKKLDYMDAIMFSPHKFLGGPSTPGVLIVNSSITKTEIPFNPGGGTVRFVCSRYTKYHDNQEARQTGGTPNIVGCIKTGLVFVLKRKYQKYITTRDQYLVEYVEHQLSKIDNLILLNPEYNLTRLPIFSFLIPGLHYNFIVTLFNDLFGIATRGGVSCCSLLAQRLLLCQPDRQDEIYQQILQGKGVPGDYGWCRISFHYSMPNYIVNYILFAIKWIANNGHKFLDQYYYQPKTNCWRYKEAKGDVGLSHHQKESEDAFNSLQIYTKPKYIKVITPATLKQVIENVKSMT